MNKNLEKNLKWVLANPDLVDIIVTEFEYGNTIKEIVENHCNNFSRHKVYAALDYRGINRRNKPNDVDEKFDRLVLGAKRKSV